MSGQANGVSSPAKPILILEDDYHQQRILRYCLEAAGLCVVVCSSVKEAMSHLREENPFSAALLDDMLPDGSGGQVLVRLRELDARLPVFFLSARSDVIASRMYAGADEYLVKPQSPEVIVNLMLRALRREQDSGPWLPQ